MIFHNCDEALSTLTDKLFDVGVWENTRGGRVLVFQEPMKIAFRGDDLVSLDPARDANPFFHLNEAIWMMSGLRDAKILDRYIHDFSARFAEHDGNIHGAYGYRWRHHFGYSQLKRAVDILRDDPSSRQVVISMWDPHFDLTAQKLKDRPCNTHIYLRIQNKQLEMTVCCRSNDLIWGLCGANHVQFGVLHQYLAACLDLSVGDRYHLINNLHAYETTLRDYDFRRRRVTPGWRRPYTDGLQLAYEKLLPQLCDDYWSGDRTSLCRLLTTAADLDRMRNGENLDLMTSWHHAAKEWLDRRKP